MRGSWRYIALALILGLSFAAACGLEEPVNQTGENAEAPASEWGTTPTVTPSGPPAPTSRPIIPKGPYRPFTVTYESTAFEPIAGPFRSEIVDLDALGDTGLVLTDEEVKEGADGHPVLAIDDRPLEEGFAVRSGPRERGVPGASARYPSCQSGSGAFVYTGTGTDVDHPLFGPYPTPTGDPVPTPPPTPRPWDPPVTDLTAEGLLDAEWPEINFERLDLEWKGERYEPTRFTYIGLGGEHWIPPESLDAIQVVEIEHELSGISPESRMVEDLVSAGKVTDRVRISRPKEFADDRVIVVETCPADLQPDEYTFFAPLGTTQFDGPLGPRSEPGPTSRSSLAPTSTPATEPAGPDATSTPTPATEPGAGDRSTPAATATLVSTPLPSVFEDTAALVARPHVLSFSPDPGASVGLDLEVCARFDVTHPAMRGWDGPIRFGIAGITDEQRRTAVDRRDDPTERSGCSSTLRKLLEEDSLESPPPIGPITVSVRYQDQDGVEHRWRWSVRFKLNTPEAPPEVLRIRELYRAVDSIDAGKGSKERTIAGYFLKDDVLHVYLLDNADPETVRTKVEAVLGEAVPPRGIRLARLNSPPDARQFNEWVDELRDLVWGADEIQLHSGSGGCCNIWDRVSYGVATVYSAHLLRQVIEQTSVPQEAVLVRVSPRATLDELSGQPTAPNGVRISLDLPKKARRGDAIPIDVVLTNTTDETVSFEYNPYLARTARIFTPDGEEVWSSHRGGVVPQPAALAELAPGEELRFTAYWSLVDQDGFALPPGRYIVRATSTFDRSVVSEPYELEVVR